MPSPAPLRTVEKVCALVLRRRVGVWQWLVFRHPMAVKGTRRPGEPLGAAAARELREETGVRARAWARLGTCTDIVPGEIWHLVLCTAPQRLSDRWRWFTRDGGGLWFAPFWQAIEAPMPGRYGSAADAARAALAHRAEAG